MTSVSTSLVRAGGRVRAIDAQVTVGGVDVARASSLWLKQSPPPEDDDAPQTAPWDVPAPDTTSVEFDGAFEVRAIGERAFGDALIRLGVDSERDREREEARRQFLSEHGRWPGRDEL